MHSGDNGVLQLHVYRAQVDLGITNADVLRGSRHSRQRRLPAKAEHQSLSAARRLKALVIPVSHSAAPVSLHAAALAAGPTHAPESLCLGHGHTLHIPQTWTVCKCFRLHQDLSMCSQLFAQGAQQLFCHVLALSLPVHQPVLYHLCLAAPKTSNTACSPCNSPWLQTA